MIFLVLCDQAGEDFACTLELEKQTTTLLRYLMVRPCKRRDFLRFIVHFLYLHFILILL